MKQSATKTLGVAALGAAFAAVGAGAANAAPALSQTGQVADTVGQVLPAGNVTKALPGADQALAPVGPTVDRTLDATRPVDSVTGLLGGLPVRTLPAKGLSVNGLPVR